MNRALLTRFLPRVPVMLNRFSKVLKTSTEAEIRSRASRLASVTTIDILSRPLYRARESRKKGKGKQPVRGYDHATRSERTSTNWAEERDEHMRYLGKPFVRKEKKNSWPDQHKGADPEDEDYADRVDVPTPKTHYMLISLLLEPAALFCTGFRKLGDPQLDTKLMFNTTLVLHGEKDRLTSMAKVSNWATPLVLDGKGKFFLVMVESSGHSWRKGEPVEDLKAVIAKWLLDQLEDESQSSLG